MRIILQEEEYMERLSSILKRDFFPSLQDEFSEPEKLSISEFQRIYTTEDNASFEELLSRENERKRKKFERIFGGPPEVLDNPDKRLLLKNSEIDEWKIKKIPFSDGRKIINWNGNTRIEDSQKPKINLKNTRFPDFKDEDLSSINLPASQKFKIPQSPAREQLAHSLSSSMTPNRISKRKFGINTPKVPSYSLNDLKALTPRRKGKE